MNTSKVVNIDKFNIVFEILYSYQLNIFKLIILHHIINSELHKYIYLNINVRNKYYFSFLMRLIIEFVSIKKSRFLHLST